MATVNFYYRSKRDDAHLVVRLLFRYDKKDYAIGSRSKILVSKKYWKSVHKKQRQTDLALINMQNAINSKMNKLRSHILEEFYSFDNPSLIDKKWLENQISIFYNPSDLDKSIPKDLVGFIDYYIEANSEKLSTARKKKFITIRNKMERFQKHLGYIIYLKDMNLDWLRKFEKYYALEDYSQNTKHRELNYIKTFCKYARLKGIDLHREFDSLKVKTGHSINIFLTFEELDKIEATKLDDADLDDARDWLLISCYTGQRISDFMRFNKSMVRVENGEPLLEFIQTKTNKATVVPVGEKVQAILDKRGGDFPKPIIKQHYNYHIKEVCRKSGIDEIVYGKKQINIAKEGDKVKSKYRNVEGEYMKYELVTSHIGRRSFASNYYGEIPTSYIIAVTGHSSEGEFLKSYMKKKSTDLAKEMSKLIR